jgi:membrane fusion protein, multidrug efflux system
MACRGISMRFLNLCVSIIMLPAVTVVMPGCKGEPAVVPPPPVEVIVSQPVTEKIEDWDTYTGTVEAKESVEIRANPTVRGQSKDVLFTEGEEIEANKLLFTIDDDPFQATLKQSEGELTTWQAKLKAAEEKIVIYKPLAEKGTISKDELVQAFGAKGEAIGGIESAKGKIMDAQNNIRYSKILSPIAGKIGQAMLTKGNIVNASGTESLLTTVISVDPLYVYFYVNQQAFLNYHAFLLKQYEKDKKAGKPEIDVKMSVEDATAFPFKGRVDFVDNKVDKSTGTYKVRARFDNPKGSNGQRKLTAGLFARIRVAIGDAYSPIMIADRAILSDQSMKYVLVVNKAKENKVERVDIVTSNRLQPDGLRPVESGLKGDEWVIVEGVNRVRPGVTVTPTESKMPRRPTR